MRPTCLHKTSSFERFEKNIERQTEIDLKKERRYGVQHKKACPSSIVVSHGLPESIQNVIGSCRAHSTPSLKISWKSNRLFSRNVVDKETSIAKIAALCGLSESIQNVIVLSMVTPRLLWKFHANRPRCFLIMRRYDRIAASRGLLELIENVIRSFYGSKIAASCGLSESV